MREATLVKAILAELKAQGAWARKIHGSAYNAGLPDVAAVVNGRAVWLEAKVPGERPTTLQQKTIDAICAAGGIAAVVTSVEDVRAVLAEARRP